MRQGGVNMNIGFVFCAVLAVFFIIMAGIFVVMGEKGAMLVSGFNTMPKEKRELYDKKRMSRDQRNMFLIWAAIMGAGAVLSLLVSAYMGAAAGAVWLIMFFREVHLDADKAFAKYLKQITICMVLILGTVAGCKVDKGLADCFDEDTLKKTGEQAVTYVNQREYEKFRDMFSEQYKDNITEELFEEITSYSDKMGEFEKFEKGAVMGQTDEETAVSYAGVIVVARYEKGKIQYRLGFTDDMKLIQFFL